MAVHDFQHKDGTLRLSTHKALPGLIPTYLSSASVVPQNSACAPTQQTPSASPIRTISDSSSPGVLPNFQVQVKCPNAGLPFHSVYNNIITTIPSVSRYRIIFILLFKWPGS